LSVVAGGERALLLRNMGFKILLFAFSDGASEVQEQARLRLNKLVRPREACASDLFAIAPASLRPLFYEPVHLRQPLVVRQEDEPSEVPDVAVRLTDIDLPFGPTR
jgi:hypothetical protein